MKLQILVLLMVVSIAVRVASCAAAEGIDLVKNGQPAVDVVIPNTPNAIESWAADDLVTYLGKMAGVRFQAVREMAYAKAEGRFVIYVGTTGPGKALLAEAGELRPDEFIMAGGTDSGQLVIVGRDEPYDPEAEVKKQEERESVIKGIGTRSNLGTCRGVWHLLRKYGGVRWYLPGELGEVVPPAEMLDFPSSVLIRKVPDFPMRDLRPGLNWTTEEFVRWYFRVGYGWPGPGVFCHHSHSKIGKAAEKAGRTDFLALKADGTKRGTGYLCLNAPGLPEFIADLMVEYFETHNYAPGSSYLLGPMDGYGPAHICECPLCILDKREAERRQQENPNPGFSRRNYCSDYVFPIVAKVAKLVKDRVPEHFVTCFAYSNYSMPPEDIEVFPDNVGIELCGPSVETIGLWSEKVKHIGIREWYLWHYWTRADPVVDPHRVAELWQFAKGRNVEGLRAETSSTFLTAPLEGGLLAMDGLNYYITARFLEDADQDVDQVLAEYFDLFYGPAAKTMAAFYHDIEYEWPKRPRSAYHAESYDDSAEFARSMMDRLHQARRQVPEDSKYAQRIDMLIHDYQPWVTLLDQKVNPRTYRCRVSEAIPNLDAVLDDACWISVQQMQFYLSQGYPDRGGFPDGLGSYCCIIRNADDLYVAVRVGTDAGPTERKRRGNEKFELIFCSPEGRRYMLRVSHGAKTSATYAPNSDEKAKWPFHGEVTDKLGEGEWTFEMRLPLADLGIEKPEDGWRINAKLWSHRIIHSPLLLGKPYMQHYRGKIMHICTWQPEGQTKASLGGFAYNPKYYGSLQFE